jgi:hypothetical protein
LGNTFYQSGFDLASQIVDGIKDKIEELNDFLADATIGEMKAYLARAQAEFDAILAKLPGAPSTVLNPNAPPVLTIGEAISQVLTPKIGAITKPITAIATTMSGAFSNIAEQTAVLKGFINQNEADALFQRRFGDTNLMQIPVASPTSVSAEQMAVAAGRISQEQAKALEARRGYAIGGIAKTPQMAMIAEKGPEAVLPLGLLQNLGNGSGGQTINLTVNAGYGADGRAIGDVIVNELKKWSRKNGKIPVNTQ